MGVCAVDQRDLIPGDFGGKTPWKRIRVVGAGCLGGMNKWTETQHIDLATGPPFCGNEGLLRGGETSELTTLEKNQILGGPSKTGCGGRNLTYSLDPEPETRNPESETRNPKSNTRNPKLHAQIPNSKPPIPNPESPIPKPDF